MIRNGSFVVVDVLAGAERANKLGGEIVGIVLEVREWRRMGYWPVGFGAERREAVGDTAEEREEVGEGQEDEGGG